MKACIMKKIYKHEEMKKISKYEEIKKISKRCTTKKWRKLITMHNEEISRTDETS